MSKRDILKLKNGVKLTHVSIHSGGSLIDETYVVTPPKPALEVFEFANLAEATAKFNELVDAIIG